MNVASRSPALSLSESLSGLKVFQGASGADHRRQGCDEAGPGSADDPEGSLKAADWATRHPFVQTCPDQWLP